MRLLTVSRDYPDVDVIADAAEVLRAGGLVAFPTETVYGLGAHALDAAAVARIYEAKGRPSYNPLIAHVASVRGARELVAEWPERAERLARAFWPGPLTLVLPKRVEVVPDALTAGLPAVAVRVPAHPVAMALIEAAGVPVAAPSANRFTELSPTRAAHVVKSLGERVDVILDGGPTDVGIESTVVDLTGPVARVLRPGTLSVDAISRALGEEIEIPGPAGPEADGDAPRLSPGMIERHYAPRAELMLFPGEAAERAEVSRALEARSGAGATAGALLLEPLGAALAVPLAWEGRMPRDPSAYAARLYAALHDADDAGCTLVAVELPPEGPEWAGVRDRLRRAATR